MADVRETLTLEDRFTGSFAKYIGAMERVMAMNDTMQAQTGAVEQAQAQQSAAAVGSYAAIESALADLIDIEASNNEMLGQMYGTFLGVTDAVLGTTLAVDQGVITLEEMQKASQKSGDALRQYENRTRRLDDGQKKVAKSTRTASAAIRSQGDVFSSGLKQITRYIAGLFSVQKIVSSFRKSAALLPEEMTEGWTRLAETMQRGVAAGLVGLLSGLQPALERINALLNSGAGRNFANGFGRAMETAGKALSVVVEKVAAIAEFVSNNWTAIEPIIYGIVAAMVAFKVATMLANGQLLVMFATMMTNPITYIALAIGAVIMFVYKFIQSCGSLEIAWLKFGNFFISLWDKIKIVFVSIWYKILDVFGDLKYKGAVMGTAIASAFMRMGAGVVQGFQQMVNAGVDLINGLANVYNSTLGAIFGRIGPVDYVTFGDDLSADVEAKIDEMNAANDKLLQSNETAKRYRQNALENMRLDAFADEQSRLLNIDNKIRELEEAKAEENNDYLSEVQGISDDTGAIAGSTASIAKTVAKTDEDLKMLIDMAERRWVNNINLTAQTPVINISGANTGNTDADRQALADAIKDVLVSQIAGRSIRSTAFVG